MSERTERPRWVKPLVLTVVIVVAIAVLFTWVFPWVESMQQDPTLGAMAHRVLLPR